MSSKKGGRFFQTVTVRLVLWYAALFVVSSLAVFLLIYVTLAASLRHRMDQDLLSHVEEFEAIYKSGGLGALMDDFKIEAESEGTEWAFFRLLSPQMDVLASSDMSKWEGLKDAPQEALKPAGAEAVYKTFRLPDSRGRVRVVYRKTHEGNVMEVGGILKHDDRLLAKFWETSGSVISAMVIFGVIMAWLLARRAMTGVERVTQTATRIAGGDLTLRVPLGGEGREIDNLANAFNNMLERIHVLMTELKEMSDNVAHDLRSPITRIRGVAETTLTGEQHLEEYQEMAVAVVEESDRLVGMINTMLEIAQTESGIADLTMRPVDLAALVGVAYELFQPLAEDEGLSMEADISAGALVVPGDVNRLQRVLANLLDNAIKYSEPGGRVVLSARRNGSHVEVSVADSGPGIAREELPHIFDRFFRLDRSRSTQGSGLGLPLALAFVRAHGGDIAVTSTPGKGSTFTVSLPIVEA